MSTLPRTRSCSAASSSASTANSNTKERVRPVSVCDASWARMSGMELRQQQLVRTPSQANNLCTTVPQSLVVQNLGGRHTPTRTSLRHSRMVVLQKNGKPVRDRRWAPYSLGRAGVLVVTAQILVGVMAMTLAAWFLMWAPTLRFREVPHYAGVPVFLAGVFGAILVSCFHRRRHSSLANVVKGILVVLCCVSVVACLCVCIFTALHLTQLASMTCHPQHTTLTHPASTLAHSTTPHGILAHPTAAQKLASIDTLHSPGFEDDEDESEGSGYNGVIEGLEFETATLDSITVSLDAEIVINMTSCACEKLVAGWRRRMTYTNLSCLEVNNILPVLFVASCVVTAVGALLSALILYLLWSFKNSFYGPAKPHETRPFIFTSNFKNNGKETNGTGTRVANGNSTPR